MEISIMVKCPCCGKYLQVCATVDQLEDDDDSLSQDDIKKLMDGDKNAG